ncbi:hypothetical protein [Brevundimonas sp.]|uniref:hypothetical protein n=1 Tax=Brevundimonas sp. TaxID=1871086 RepID=UPI0028A05971|nr:hypothetical protein [Brevundimonas sp.]
MTDAPAPIQRPKLAHWMFARNISNTEAAEQLECSRQTVLNITQPFGAATRTVPHEALMERIVRWTGGEVTAADFYPPHLNGQAVQPEGAMA